MREGKFFCEIIYNLIIFILAKKWGGGAKAPPALPSARSLNNTLAGSFLIEKKPERLSLDM